jgi:tRNA(Ile)-lysidine synthase
MHPLHEKVLAFIRAEDLIRPGERVLAAVSGGPDSMALVGALRAIAPEIRFELEAAHLDHGLRPSSGEEAARVAAWMRDLGIPCAVERARDLRPGPDLERRAREARLGYLERTAAERGCAAIATGHHADDSAESILLHLARGSGLKGLGGIHPRRGPFVRPLLPLRRGQILEILEETGTPHLTDLTNFSLEHARNRVRHHVIPLLESELNPRVVEALLRLGERAAGAQEVLDRAAEALLEGRVREEGAGASVLDLDSWENYHKTLQLYALRRFLKSWDRPGSPPEASHLERLLELIADPRGTGKAVDLPGGLRASRRYGELVVERRGDGTRERDPRRPSGARARTLRIPGTTTLPEDEGRVIRATLRSPGEVASLDSTPDRACFDAARIRPPVRARPYRRGDRMRPHGMSGRRKLSDLFTDRKVPRKRRAACWVVEDREEIVWVPGVSTSESTRVIPETREVLELEILSGPERNAE